jgi:hypothetical protein
VPPGVYRVDDESGRKLRVTVRKPLLVPCLAERAGKRTSSQAQKYISQKVGTKKLMTKEIALVVHQHFKHELGGKYGVLFPRASEGEFEAFLDAQEVGLFFFDPDRAGNERIRSTDEHFSNRVQTGREVFFRAIEEL